MEFAVEMSCQSCADAVKRALEGQPGTHHQSPHPAPCSPAPPPPDAGVESVYVCVEDEVVLVQTSLLSSQVQELLESTGKLVVFRGYGGTGRTQGV